MNTPEVLAAPIANLPVKDQVIIENLIQYLEDRQEKSASSRRLPLHESSTNRGDHAELLRPLAEGKVSSGCLTNSVLAWLRSCIPLGASMRCPTETAGSARFQAAIDCHNSPK